MARNATLEEVVADLDLRSPDGSSGVTPSMLSGWELGRHATSIPYRRLLCDYYGESSEVLFAHQDEMLTTAGEIPRLLVGYQDLAAALAAVVAGARRYLVVTGSRSRDPDYLGAIEDALRTRPELVHYRVLFGAPHHGLLRQHLLRLLELRDPEDRSHGQKTLHIGIIEDTTSAPERFFCASEREAVLPIASLTSAEAFDSGVRLGPSSAERLIDHARQCYAAARRVETHAEVLDLPVVRDGGASSPGSKGGR